MEKVIEAVQKRIFTEAELFVEALTELGQTEISIYVNGWELSAKKINKVYKDEQ